VKLNLGCGPIQPPGWVNVDGSNRAWLVSKAPWLDSLLVSLRVFPGTDFDSTRLTWADLTRRFPWEDGSVSAIYLGEVVEHFTMEQAEHIFRESRRVLTPGGIIRVRVPDNAAFWSNYLHEYAGVRSRPRKDWDDNHSRWVRMFFGDICVGRLPPWASIGHFHKWMWDEVSLCVALDRAGFAGACRMGFRESGIPGIEQVEARDDLIVEARTS
jgi:predicted SAM-dependent methyltransferase